ncbi:MAG: hypothetical protein J0L53_08505 [Spirochaetes bacterium]|nr:hypothetical protein [Spirochaetota bacterium]MBX3724264.1 hypothetical protein [Turneriella sp.]
MKIQSLFFFTGVFFLQCTYDSTPPGDEKINDNKPLLMIDATGFNPQRAVQIQYTDLLGTTTLQTSAEKTDASGRFLYPLYMTRGSRSFSITIIVDQDANGSFGGGTDKTYTQSGNFSSDSETKKLQLTVANFL